MTDSIGKRLWAHACYPLWRVRGLFPESTLKQLENEIAASEQRHLGQIRFVIESAMPLMEILHRKNPRERALDYFGLLRMWDTQHNSGVLLYVNVADHAIEIVADRGIAAAAAPEEWTRICADVEKAFRQQRYEEGLNGGIRALDTLLTAHFPRSGEPFANELADEIVLR